MTIPAGDVETVARVAARVRESIEVVIECKPEVVTTAITWRRRRSFHERPVEFLPEASSPDQVDVLATPEVLIWHLRGLPPRQRAVIVLRYYEDLTEVQTAEIMGCSVGAVKSHVSTGLGRLRERMGPAFDLVPTGEEGVTS